MKDQSPESVQGGVPPNGFRLKFCRKPGVYVANAAYVWAYGEWGQKTKVNLHDGNLVKKNFCSKEPGSKDFQGVSEPENDGILEWFPHGKKFFGKIFAAILRPGKYFELVS